MEFNNGPDQIVPADNLITTEADGAVKFRTSNDNFEKSVVPKSVASTLKSIAETCPDAIAMISAPDAEGKQIKYTYRKYEENVRNCAKGFLKLGLQRFHSVCILGFNCPQWFFANLGAIYAGGISVGVYTTNSTEACFYVADHSNVNIFVVEDNEHLQKILAIRDRLPNLKAIVQYTGKPVHADVLSWDQLIDLGREQSDVKLDQVLKTLAINQCCTLIYTSGTTGNPKGVLLSHDNLIYEARAIAKKINMQFNKETIISYLPLSHIAAQMVDIYCVLVVGSTTYFADRNALKGSLLKTLTAARPTRFLGVPRVWEKIQEKMVEVGAQRSFIAKNIGIWAKKQGLQRYLNKINGNDTPTWQFLLADTLIFKKIKQALGFDRCLTFASAAAPLTYDIKEYFISIGIPLVEAYGMSEVSGAHTLDNPDKLNLKSVGSVIAGLATKFVNIDKNTNEGEICMFGRHVFMGYLKDPEKTAETIDEDGWIHSGDLGKTDEAEMLYVTGRLKELLITAGGENIAPVPIEHLITKKIPQVRNAILIGDKRKFLSVLLTLKTEVDPETSIPTNTLTKEVETWLKTLGSDATTVTEVLEEGPLPTVLAEIQKGIDEVNSYAISNAQRIQKFAILPRDISLATDELGPTLKLKRHVVLKNHATLIDKLYS